MTGASGFIGSHCIPLLAEGHYDIHALGRKTGPSNHPRVTWHECDLLDFGQCKSLLKIIQPTKILHLAWFSEHGSFWKHPANLDWVGASLNLLRCATEIGVSRIIGVGTCAEYGINQSLCNEIIGNFSPVGTYAECKYATQLCFRAAQKSLGISTAWALLFFPYGPHDNPNRMVPYAIQSLLNDIKAEFSSGTQVRDPLYVEDVASALVALLESKVEGPINIASGNATSVSEIVETIGAVTEKSNLIKLGIRDQISDESSRWVASINRLSEEVGWKPTFNLEAGLKKTIDWHRNQIIKKTTDH